MFLNRGRKTRGDKCSALHSNRLQSLEAAFRPRRGSDSQDEKLGDGCLFRLVTFLVSGGEGGIRTHGTGKPYA